MPRRSIFKLINTATTTQVHTGPALLDRITVNTSAAGTTVLYDNTGGDTTIPVANLPTLPAVGTYEYGCVLANGIKVVTGGVSDITVIYSSLP